MHWWDDTNHPTRRVDSALFFSDLYLSDRQDGWVHLNCIKDASGDDHDFCSLLATDTWVTSTTLGLCFAIDLFLED